MHSNTGSKTDEKASNSPKSLQRSEVFALQSQNYRLSECEFGKLQRADQLCALLACIGLICAVIEYDIERWQREEVLAVVVATGNGSTGLLMWALGLRLQQELRWEQATSVASQYATFWSARKHWRLLVEVLLTLPHPIWWARDQTFESNVDTLAVTVRYSYNSMLSVWSLARLYLLFRLICSLSAYHSSRAQRVCQLQGTQAGIWFATRGLVAAYPAIVLIVLFFGGAFVAGWMLYIFESPLASYTSTDYSYRNMLWLVLISMTTVGYGDIYPCTVPGRIVAILSCIWGVVILSLIVLSLTTQLQPTTAQATSYSLLQRLQFHQQLTSVAASFIASAGRCAHFSKSKSAEQLRKEQILLRDKINAFQRMRIQRRVLYGVDKFPETMERELAELEEGSGKSLAQVAALKLLVQELVSLC